MCLNLIFLMHWTACFCLIFCVILLIVGLILALKFCEDWREEIWNNAKAERIYYILAGTCCFSLLVLIVLLILLTVMTK